MRDKGIKINCERFIMNMPVDAIARVENLARKNGITMSWFYRALLSALLKKFDLVLPDVFEIKRPIKFTSSFRQITICFYGDKPKWMTLSRIWQVELGPLIRFALDLYFKGELKVDLESLATVKEAKNHSRGTITFFEKYRGDNRYIYRFQNEAQKYQLSDYRPKNPEKNIFLMEMGLRNRKYTS